MRSICLHFEIHQPLRFRTYRFFDINDHNNYYDEYQNRYLTKRLAERSYLPMNQLILELIQKYPKNFKIAFSISGTSLELFQLYVPEVIESFKALVATGNVEFTGTTFNHSLAALKDEESFCRQVKDEEVILKKIFGITPKTFYNTELIYSDDIGEWLDRLGYRTVLTEGAKHILGWKSSHFVYCNPFQTNLKILLRDFNLSDDLSFRFNDSSWDNYPLTADRYAEWIDNELDKEQVCNLFMDYETFGEYNVPETGIFEFFKVFVDEIIKKKITFNTPQEITKHFQSISTLHVPFPISDSGEEKDISEWLGNELQEEAFRQVYDLKEAVKSCHNPRFIQDYNNLQCADNFNFMCTKWFAYKNIRHNMETYPSPYQIFINYMNILSDLKLRLKQTKK